MAQIREDSDDEEFDMRYHYDPNIIGANSVMAGHLSFQKNARKR